MQISYKTIFSLQLYLGLTKAGFTPILEKDNINKPGLKCWVYERTPEFQATLDRLFEALEGGPSA